ncbi:MAG: YbhB/YbcL family Raf kinase inhibitor-like protein [Chitinophagales bacterium]|nr:YbhB/YbcL family Raf kinase inhibitor-like protein [Chitinophagales bacterium]
MRSLLITMMCALSLQMIAQDKLEVTSKDFQDNELMPMKYSCEGNNTSPSLEVHGIPHKARTLAVIMHDPDAPITGGFTHWVVWNMSTKSYIPGDFEDAEQGLNGAQKKGYIGMCPPSGTHHYNIRVYALDAKLKLKANAGKADLEKAMKGHILAEGMITGLYKKQGK